MLLEVTSGALPVTPTAIYWLCEGDAPAPSPAWLSAEELAAYAALRHDKRRRDWLLGRHVAKRLLGRVLLATLGRAVPPCDIAILRHADGWPQVVLPDDMHAPPLTLSISHTGALAFCAVGLGADRPLGADIETVEPRSAGFVEDYFTAHERALLAAVPLEQHPVLANTIWSGKEAALKAIRRGLAEDTRLVTCLPAPDGAAEGWRSLHYYWEATERALPHLAGWWCEMDGFVMTVAAGTASHAEN